ncbi:MAG: glycoside hydrolase family 3 N-terminal domain-containing protein [Bacillota bacterium]|nr:glycoside hydrolase family 3 N-terminal domain-containing protein [Bacillota bacterium]
MTAKRILETMTLEEKAAQLLMVSCHTQGSAESAAKFGVGALCLYSFDFAGKSSKEVADMTQHFQELSGFPMIISTDEEGGGVHRVSNCPELYPETFRSPGELRESNGLTSVSIDTRAKSVLLESLGINANLAPVCDVPLKETDYIYERCYSMDYKESAEYISAVITAMNDYNVGSVLKHFPGYGGSTDTHYGISYDYRPLAAFINGDLLPFKAGIEAGADAVMVSHNIVVCMDDSYPASLSAEVHRVLREELGFEGVIVTDDLAMGAILNFADGKNMVVQALIAGNDMVCCSNFEESTAAIVAAVNNGTLTEERIDESVLRILKWKIDLDLI